MTLIERLYRLVPLDTLPADTTPPATLGAFIFHFVRQILPLLVMLVVMEAMMAFAMVMVPIHLGWVIDMVNRNQLEDWALWTGAAALVGGPTLSVILWWIYDHVYNPQFGNMMRRQLNHYTLGHALAYYNNDYAGRIANKVLESGPALREIVRSTASSVWYAGFFAVSVVVALVNMGGLVAVPVIVWLVAYITALCVFVPRVRRLSMTHSGMHSTLVGHVVDTYTHVTLVKLFARQRHEDDRIYATLQKHTGTMRDATHAMWLMRVVIMTANVAMMLGTSATVVYLWLQGSATAGVIAMTLPMVWQLNNMSGWIMNEVTSVFENLGRVEECMATLAKPHTVTDVANAKDLTVTDGRIQFQDVRFHYGKDGGVMDRFNLGIRSGEKVGVVGRSGAGKSTLINLLLRFYDLEGGTILIDGQNIAHARQESVREAIGVVQQDNSLMNRSIRDNLLLGRPNATEEEIVAAAKRAHAHEFILGLEDLKGNKGYDAQVGERGVKLSGGQRQRIALARVFLKNAPILILDEATSALDSESEEAILENMEALMEGGRTVLVIAHRLATLRGMDRIVVMDQGRIVESGTHNQLIELNGIYAMLCAKQSHEFLAA